MAHEMSNKYIFSDTKFVSCIFRFNSSTEEYRQVDFRAHLKLKKIAFSKFFSQKIEPKMSKKSLSYILNTKKNRVLKKKFPKNEQNINPLL